MKILKSWYWSVLAMLSMVIPSMAFATTDTTWVTTALDAAKTDILAYILAAVPDLFVILTLVVAVFLVIKLFRRSAR